MPVRMELSRIIISEISSQQVIYLQEVDGPRSFPISIGIFEATSIDRRVKDIKTPRPLTHDLLCNVIKSMGGTPKEVIITDLEDATFFAKLRIQQGDQTINVDARPSDAIAIAMSCDPPLPIFVAESVLESVNEPPPGQ